MLPLILTLALSAHAAPAPLLLTEKERSVAADRAKELKASGKLGELKTQLKSPNRKTRALAAFGAMMADIPELATIMTGLLEDDDQAVRRWAAFYFASNAYPGYSGAMLKLLKDPDADLRAKAVVYLARVGSDSEKAAAQALSSDPAANVREVVAARFPPAPRPLKVPTAEECAEEDDLAMYGGPYVPASYQGVVRRKGESYYLARPDGQEMTLGANGLASYEGRQVRVAGCGDKSSLLVFDLASP
jgi:hypothetical protein